MGLGDFINEPTVIYGDNNQANRLCAEDMVTSGNMYFRTGYHYNKEAVRDGYCTIERVDTHLNIADALTKALGPNKIRQFTPLLQCHGDAMSNIVR